jgi:hypothetical protein
VNFPIEPLSPGLRSLRNAMSQSRWMRACTEHRIKVGASHLILNKIGIVNVARIPRRDKVERMVPKASKNIHITHIISTNCSFG